MSDPAASRGCDAFLSRKVEFARSHEGGWPGVPNEEAEAALTARRAVLTGDAAPGKWG